VTVPTGTVPGSGRAIDKQDRVARLYDTELLPAYAGRFGALALRALDVRPGARILEVGCATGHLTLEMSRRFDLATRITAFDAEPAMLALARAKVEGDARARGRVSLELGAPGSLVVPEGGFDIVVSNLALSEAHDRAAGLAHAARALAPGGTLAITAALRGTWTEFLDIYADVLRENDKRDSLAALEAYVASMPDGDTAARWLEATGLGDVTITIERWEILFKSAREFFFAPVIELGPLSRWKQIAGRGDEMQDIFFFTKEAIDTYFKHTPFAVTIVGAAITGGKAAPAR
jgi:ubiquinone/menaquinone biosynthesis C-methylase UbiE